jgi:DSBA-like thioredoxin domain
LQFGRFNHINFGICLFEGICKEPLHRHRQGALRIPRLPAGGDPPAGLQGRRGGALRGGAAEVLGDARPVVRQPAGLAPEKLSEHTQALGLEAAAFKDCLDSGRYAERVRKDIAEGQKLGITGTPTMLLGVSEGNQVKEVKMLRGAQPFSVFKAEIDKSLAAMAATP